MWEMFMSSASLFIKGKMFRDNTAVFMRSAIGVAIGAILLVVLGKFLLPLWAAALVAGVVTGAAIPFLMKDLKYA